MRPRPKSLVISDLRLQFKIFKNLFFWDFSIIVYTLYSPFICYLFISHSLIYNWLICIWLFSNHLFVIYLFTIHYFAFIYLLFSISQLTIHRQKKSPALAGGGSSVMRTTIRGGFYKIYLLTILYYPADFYFSNNSGFFSNISFALWDNALPWVDTSIKFSFCR